MAANTEGVKAVFSQDGILYTDSDQGRLDIGPEGPWPMDMVLMAVAGCSGLTFRSLLERDGFNPERLELSVEGIKNEKSPRKFVEIFVKYDIKCDGLTDSAVKKYIVITERSCPVVQSLSAKTHASYNLIQ